VVDDTQVVDDTRVNTHVILRRHTSCKCTRSLRCEPVEVSCAFHHARLSRSTSLTTCFRKEMQIGQSPQLILHEENNAAQEACLVTH
jgi:hypothetical protein